MGQKAVLVKILLLGSNGQLGRELEHQLPAVGNLTALTRTALDITNHQEVWEAVKLNQPDIIINAAAYTAVDRAEAEVEYAHAVNADAVANLAQIAKAERLWLIHYSTDYVFDGAKSGPYLETDSTNPINIYGASKLAGEKAILETKCQHLIFRISWVIGKTGNNFAKTILRLLSQQDTIEVVNDQLGVPTTTSLIAKVTVDAIHEIIKRRAWPNGIYHLAPHGLSNWYDVAQTLQKFIHDKKILTNSCYIQAISSSKYLTAARRPMNSQLDNQKLLSHISFKLPHWKKDFLIMVNSILEDPTVLGK